LDEAKSPITDSDPSGQLVAERPVALPPICTGSTVPLLELLKERQKLQDRGQSPTAAAVREIVAKRIIEAAVSGERNPDELARQALEAIGVP
jgi:hypothetical protein